MLGGTPTRRAEEPPWRSTSRTQDRCSAAPANQKRSVGQAAASDRRAVLWVARPEIEVVGYRACACVDTNVQKWLKWPIPFRVSGAEVPPVQSIAIVRWGHQATVTHDLVLDDAHASRPRDAESSSTVGRCLVSRWRKQAPCANASGSFAYTLGRAVPDPDCDRSGRGRDRVCGPRAPRTGSRHRR
jgi:hypothetical protein